MRLNYVETQSKDAAFHFSLEEYIVQHFPFSEPVLMIWQADKCVMLGNYQVAGAEIDLSCAKKEGIQIVRRSSGGGTIFTDLGTFLYTLITPCAQELSVQQARNLIVDMVVRALSEMGVPAKFEGRNDITVGGKKISGLAQYVKHGRICSHGSLLYDADLDMLTRVLRVDEEKIRSKAIRSVRSRVTNIKEHISPPLPAGVFLEQFKRNIFECLNVQPYTLTENDLAQVDEIYRSKYGNPCWTLVHSPEFAFHSNKRFAGGKVEVFLNITGGKVTSCSIRGDFLGTVPIRRLEQLFEGRTFERGEFESVLAGRSLQPYLGSITTNELISCIFD